MLLKGAGKEAVTPKDTSYKIELIPTPKNKYQRVWAWTRTNEVGIVKDAKPQHLWMVMDNDHALHFMDYIRLRIIHGKDTMTISLKYNANTTTNGGTYINESLDTTREKPGYNFCFDTIIFTKGDFCLKSRKDYNYWKKESKRPAVITYGLKKYYYDYASGRNEFVWDTLRLYRNVNIKKGKMRCIQVNSKGVMVARGKKRYDPEGGGFHRPAWQPYGRWYFYDNGKFISSRIVYGVKKL
ncbi:MAG: hypothetical protein Q8M29_17880 [Bacteroidota bacterium]|nr:hypothetical protein [Bacteroidota bacterium]